ncbi:MAG: hydrogenase maturation protease [Candidatus Cloacimonetes bacterium]|nr:hydrogenase maturation protease [Candidatus Cloacimonadota bacterium]
MKLEEFLETKLSDYQKDEITFLGLGNPYRSDDGFGIEFIKRIKDNFANAYTEFDNVDEVILKLMDNKKGILIFVDVSDFEGNPGDIKILSYDDVEDIGKHFHKIPIKLYMKLLKNSNKESYILAIKPKSLKEVNEPKLSDIVETQLKNLINLIIEQFN